MRIAVIDEEKCIAPEDCDYICRGVCPVNRSGKDCIKVEDEKPKIDENLCIGCGICPKKCPADAISIVNLPEELSSDAIYRYSENGFELFGVPVPTFGKVIGILGRNGIGKTTALDLLSGGLRVNFGEPGKEPSKSEVIDFLRGTEAQSYFEKLYDDEVDVSYKPQRVEGIPKKYSGEVRDLLSRKVPENEDKLSKVVNELGLGKIMEREIEDLSGGELQKVAIAATVLEDSDVLFFDEPSSYLDIKERLNVAEYIRSLSSTERNVTVVEHDLIILDYMTDLVHIMYGKPGVYGVISHLLSTRNAINSFLKGYLKDGNVRFRDFEIEFEVKGPKSTGERESLLKWPHLSKSFDNFDLEVSEGDVREKEVVGCLGENATGKTTFAKMLAGLIDSDEGDIDGGVDISYKPQYLSSDSDKKVEFEIKDACEGISYDRFKDLVIKPLDIEEILDRKVSELSGGELQRVSIAVCLARDADIYLLDEPSAYLDVEQRINLASIIKNLISERNASSLVIDHDLLFIDYISDRLLIFKGEPSQKGETLGPLGMEEGMNEFLREVGITMRRDEGTKRPRINKVGSVKDREQKKEGNYYYS